MTTIFCHIGWMKNYRGESDDDWLQGGGSYVDEQETGHEICNFADVDGRLYGYVQVGKGKNGKYQEASINFARLGAALEEQAISNATIIWTAPKKTADSKNSIRRVVGWYREATIHRNYQKFESSPVVHEANGLTGYWFSAPTSCCVLIPFEERTYDVPRMVKGFPGISPIWYGDSSEGADFVAKTLSFIDSYVGKNLLLDQFAVQERDIASISQNLESNGYFNSQDMEDARARQLREIVQRRGQRKFRLQLLNAYGGRCCITGCDAIAALEAAHIIGYMGEASQHVSNGLLLRADIHSLFDLGLLEICPDTLRVILAPALRESSYATLHEQPVVMPSAESNYPDTNALRMRWEKGLASSW